MTLVSETTFAALREMAGEQLVNELIDVFLEEAPKMIDAMHDALGTQSVDDFRRNAHSLKSNADTFGASDLAALARDLEVMARAGDLQVGSRLEELRVACGRVSEELRGLRT